MEKTRIFVKMKEETCFVCCEITSGSLNGSETRIKDSLLKSLIEVLGISYSTFTGDFLAEGGEENVVKLQGCEFCGRCENLIVVGADLRRNLLDVKQSLVDAVIVGYQERQRRKRNGEDSGVDTTSEITRSALAFRLGECFTKPAVLIRPEDEIPEERLLIPVTEIEEEDSGEEQRIIEEDDDYESDGYQEIEEEMSPPPAKRKRGRPRKITSLPKRVREGGGGRRRGRPPKEKHSEFIEAGNDSMAKSPSKSARKRGRPSKTQDMILYEDIDRKSNQDSGEEALQDDSGYGRRLRRQARIKKPGLDMELSCDSDDQAIDVEFRNVTSFGESSESSDGSGNEERTNSKPKRGKPKTEQEYYDQRRRFPCGGCGVKWPTIKRLERHVKGTLGVCASVDRPYGCGACPAWLATREELEKHVIHHRVADGQSGNCKLCEESDSLPSLVGHYYQEHGLDLLGLKYFGCAQCFQTFKPNESGARSGSVSEDDLSTLKAFAYNHSNCRSTKDLSYTPQQCRICTESRITAAELILHESTHFPDLYCIYCDYELQSERTLKVHNTLYHRKRNNSVNVLRPQLRDKLLRNHQCNICKRRFGKSSSLKHHMAVHAADKEKAGDLITSSFAGSVDQKCPVCDFSCFAFVNFFRHMKVIHNLMPFARFDDYFYNCYSCLELFQPSDPIQPPGVLRHKDMQKLQDFAADHANCRREPISEFLCPKCEGKFDNPKGLFKHVLDDHKQDMKEFSCATCPSVFENNLEYLYHLRQQHNDRVKLKCQCYRCGKQFQDSESLRMHVHQTQDTTDPPPPYCTQLNGGYPCLSCDELFDSVTLLTLHFQEHHDNTQELSFKCTVCLTVLQSSEALQKKKNEIFYVSENNLKHSDFTSLCQEHWKTCISSPNADSSCNEGPSLQCYVCSQDQDSPQGLAAHLNIQHHGASEVHRCPACTLVFGRWKHLSTHLKHDHYMKQWHSDRFYCHECFEPFQSTNPASESGAVSEQDMPQFHAFLERHFQCKADQIKQRKCKFCSIELADVTHIFSHEISYHTKKYKHICDHCGKGFSELYGLNKHVQQHEMEKGVREKPTCRICGKQFTRSKYLEEHLRTHQEDKEPPLVCQHCGKGFYIKSSLARHEMNHSVVLPTEPTVPCTVCGKLFVTVKYMKYHVKYTHEKHKRDSRKRSSTEPPTQGPSGNHETSWMTFR